MERDHWIEVLPLKPEDTHRVVRVEGGFICHPDDRPDHRESRKRLEEERRKAGRNNER